MFLVTNKQRETVVRNPDGPFRHYIKDDKIRREELVNVFKLIKQIKSRKFLYSGELIHQLRSFVREQTRIMECCYSGNAAFVQIGTLASWNRFYNAGFILSSVDKYINTEQHKDIVQKHSHFYDKESKRFLSKNDYFCYQGKFYSNAEYYKTPIGPVDKKNRRHILKTGELEFFFIKDFGETVAPKDSNSLEKTQLVLENHTRYSSNLLFSCFKIGDKRILGDPHQGHFLYLSEKDIANLYFDPTEEHKRVFEEYGISQITLKFISNKRTVPIRFLKNNFKTKNIRITKIRRHVDLIRKMIRLGDNYEK